MSPRVLTAGESRPATTLDAMPGAGLPVSATGRTRPADQAKIPSTALPPDTAAANATSPVSLNAGVGCLPKPDRRPMPGTRSPSRATMRIRSPRRRKMPSSAEPRLRRAKKATSPRALTGAITGRFSWPKRSKTPPPGAASPTRATARSAWGSAPYVAVAGASRPSARTIPPTRDWAWRAGICREYRNIEMRPQ